MTNDNETLWGSINARLPAETTGNDRLPFFGWRDVPADTPLRITLLSEPRTQGLVSGFAIFEFDGRLDAGKASSDYLFSVSGNRLARAIGKCHPGKGDTIVLKARGEAKEREWTCSIG